MQGVKYHCIHSGVYRVYSLMVEHIIVDYEDIGSNPFNPVLSLSKKAI